MSFQSSTIKGLVTTGHVGLSLKGVDDAGSSAGFKQKKLTFPEAGMYACTGILSAEFSEYTVVNNNVLEFSSWNYNGSTFVSTPLVKICASFDGDQKIYSGTVTLIVKVDVAGDYLQGALDPIWQGAVLGQFALQATKLC